MSGAVGAITALWRYPVKSMLGEALASADVGDHGVVGDRAYALLDRADGKVATAKNPRHDGDERGGVVRRGDTIRLIS